VPLITVLFMRQYHAAALSARRCVAWTSCCARSWGAALRRRRIWPRWCAPAFRPCRRGSMRRMIAVGLGYLADDAPRHPAAGAEGRDPKCREHLIGCSRTRRCCSSSASSISSRRLKPSRVDPQWAAPTVKLPRVMPLQPLCISSSATAWRAMRSAMESVCCRGQTRGIRTEDHVPSQA